MDKLVCNARRHDGTVCGYRWQSRVPNPKKCPECGSRTWNRKE